jgi:hypothetical protein
MTTQSKSVLVPFLIVSGLLLAAALGWKFMANDGDQKAVSTTTAKTEIKAVVAEQPKQTAVAQPADTDMGKQEVSQPESYETPQEREAAMKQARLNMSYAMRYPTPEKALEALEKFNNDGNQEMVSTIVAFMGQAYPNTAIPAKFLDQ